MLLRLKQPLELTTLAGHGLQLRKNWLQGPGLVIMKSFVISELCGRDWGLNSLNRHEMENGMIIQYWSLLPLRKYFPRGNLFHPGPGQANTMTVPLLKRW